MAHFGPSPRCVETGRLNRAALSNGELGGVERGLWAGLSGLVGEGDAIGAGRPAGSGAGRRREWLGGHAAGREGDQAGGALECAGILRLPGLAILALNSDDGAVGLVIRRQDIAANAIGDGRRDGIACGVSLLIGDDGHRAGCAAAGSGGAARGQQRQPRGQADEWQESLSARAYLVYVYVCLFEYIGRAHLECSLLLYISLGRLWPTIPVVTLVHVLVMRQRASAHRLALDYCESPS